MARGESRTASTAAAAPKAGCRCSGEPSRRCASPRPRRARPRRFLRQRAVVEAAGAADRDRPRRSSLLLLSPLGVASYLALAGAVEEANQRLLGAPLLDQQTGLLMSTSRRRSCSSAPTTATPTRGRDGARTRSCCAHRPDARPHRVPLDPARPARATCPAGAREDQRGVPDGRPRRSRSARSGTFTGLQVNHMLVIDFRNFVQLIDALGGVEIDVPEPIVANKFDCPFKTQQHCERWSGWRFGAGQADDERTARARLLAHPREPSQPGGERPHARRAPAGGRARDRRQDDVAVDAREDAVDRGRPHGAARDGPLGRTVRSARLGEVARRQRAALPPRWDAVGDRRRVVPDRERGEPERRADVPRRGGAAAATRRERARTGPAASSA